MSKDLNHEYHSYCALRFLCWLWTARPNWTIEDSAKRDEYDGRRAGLRCLLSSHGVLPRQFLDVDEPLNRHYHTIDIENDIVFDDLNIKELDKLIEDMGMSIVQDLVAEHIEDTTAVFGLNWWYMYSEAKRLNIKNEFTRMFQSKCVRQFDYWTQPYDCRCVRKNDDVERWVKIVLERPLTVDRTSEWYGIQRIWMDTKEARIYANHLNGEIQSIKMEDGRLARAVYSFYSYQPVTIKE